MIDFLKNNFDLEEIIIPLVLSLSIIIFFKVFNIYSDINTFNEPIRNILLSIASALIGFAGIILAGIAIVISMLNRDILRTIEKVNYKGVISPIFQSYKVLMFLTLLQILSFYGVYFLLYTESALINENIFLIGTFILSFLFVLLLIYVFNIVCRCIDLFNVINIYSDAMSQDELFKQEVRKNIVKFITEHNFKTPEEYKRNLIIAIQQEFEEKEALRRIKIVNELL